MTSDSSSSDDDHNKASSSGSSSDSSSGSSVNLGSKSLSNLARSMKGGKDKDEKNGMDSSEFSTKNTGAKGGMRPTTPTGDVMKSVAMKTGNISNKLKEDRNKSTIGGSFETAEQTEARENSELDSMKLGWSALRGSFKRGHMDILIQEGKQREAQQQKLEKCTQTAKEMQEKLGAMKEFQNSITLIQVQFQHIREQIGQSVPENISRRTPDTLLRVMKGLQTDITVSHDEDQEGKLTDTKRSERTEKELKWIACAMEEVSLLAVYLSEALQTEKQKMRSLQEEVDSLKGVAEEALEAWEEQQHENEMAALAELNRREARELAEMAQQKKAALKATPDTESKPAVTDTRGLPEPELKSAPRSKNPEGEIAPKQADDDRQDSKLTDHHDDEHDMNDEHDDLLKDDVSRILGEGMSPLEVSLLLDVTKDWKNQLFDQNRDYESETLQTCIASVQNMYLDIKSILKDELPATDKARADKYLVATDTCFKKWNTRWLMLKAICNWNRKAMSDSITLLVNNIANLERNARGPTARTGPLSLFGDFESRVQGYDPSDAAQNGSESSALKYAALKDAALENGAVVGEEDEVLSLLSIGHCPRCGFTGDETGGAADSDDVGYLQIKRGLGFDSLGHKYYDMMFGQNGREGRENKGFRKVLKAHYEKRVPHRFELRDHQPPNKNDGSLMRKQGLFESNPTAILADRRKEMRVKEYYEARSYCDARKQQIEDDQEAQGRMGGSVRIERVSRAMLSQTAAMSPSSPKTSPSDVSKKIRVPLKSSSSAKNSPDKSPSLQFPPDDQTQESNSKLRGSEHEGEDRNLYSRLMQVEQIEKSQSMASQGPTSQAGSDSKNVDDPDVGDMTKSLKSQVTIDSRKNDDNNNAADVNDQGPDQGQSWIEKEISTEREEVRELFIAKRKKNRF